MANSNPTDRGIAYANAENIPEKLVTSVSTFIKKGKLADILKQKNTLYNNLDQYGMVSTYSGGVETRIPLAEDEVDTYTRIDGHESMVIEHASGFTAAQYKPVSIAANIMLSRAEILDNSGPDQIVPLISGHMKRLMTSVVNNFSADLYSDGTEKNQISGLQSMIRHDTTSLGNRFASVSTVVVPGWDNQRKEIQGTVSYDTFLDAVDEGIIDADFGSIPNKAMSSVNLFNVVQKGNRGQLEINALQKDRKPEQAHNSYSVRGCDVVYDHNVNFGKTINRCYFINTDDLFLKFHKDAYWKVEDPEAAAGNFQKIKTIYARLFPGLSQRKTQLVVFKS